MASVIEGGGIQGSSYMNNPDQRSADTEESRSGAAAKASEIAHAGKEKVKEMSGVARERVYSRVDSRKGEIVEGMHQLADTLEKASKDVPDGIARTALNSTVGFIHKATDRIEHGSTEELLREAQDQVRERPGLFVAGCVALGFLAGRFVKI